MLLSHASDFIVDPILNKGASISQAFILWMIGIIVAFSQAGRIGRVRRVIPNSAIDVAAPSREADGVGGDPPPRRRVVHPGTSQGERHRRVVLIPEPLVSVAVARAALAD